MRSFGFSEGARVLPQVPRHLPRHLRRSRWVPRHLPRRSRRSRWVPRHLPRRLRRSRKSHGICRGVCAGCAGSHGICRGVCAGCASPAAFAKTFAQAAQVPRHLPRRLCRSRKSRSICRVVCAGRAGSRSICRDVCAGRASSKIFVGACLFVDNGRPAYGSPRANLLMACSMSPPRRSAKRITSTFSVSSVVYARYSSRETSVA